MKRTLAAIALTVIFTMALAVPAFGQDMNYEATFNFDGDIDFEMQAGHYCNTGAEMQQTISGTGALSKDLNVFMESGYIAVDDSNDWVTAPDAIRNLTVTTGILLCAPAKHVYGEDDGDYAEGDVVSSDALYGARRENAVQDEWSAVSDQIWAVQVSADPGYSGQIDMGFEAAHSDHIYGEEDPGDDRYMASWLEGVDSETWAGLTSTNTGPWFPGSFFNIEQFSRTSQGTHRRYIDISSPNTHGYLMEDMTVVGMSEVWEEFSFVNREAGDEVGMLWYDMF